MALLQKYKELENHCEHWLKGAKAKPALEFNEILNSFIGLDEINFRKMAIKLRLTDGILFLWLRKGSEAPKTSIKRDVVLFILQEVRWEIHTLYRLLYM